MTREAPRARKKEVNISDSLARDYVAGILSTPTSWVPGTRQPTLALMMHGFPGNRGSHHGFLESLEPVFAEKGVSTFRFDFRGCGESQGEKSLFSLNRAAEDIDLVLNWAHRQGFKKFIFVAEGLGARIALTRINLDVLMLFLFWPVLDSPDYARRVPGISPEDNKTLIELQDDPPLPTQLLEIPIQVHYGAADDIVSRQNIDILKERLKAPRLDITLYQDGSHGLPAPAHRQMAAVHVGLFLEKFLT